ncbi:MAG: T9SS type A sorting domain-containing protein [Chitinophagaceae bacterium]|nr:T9SS type A sorting domain-containing protein [Chitinophagaceae bacterium]
MKNLICCGVLWLYGLHAHSQTHFYINFLSHNEETTSWNGSLYYNNNRSRLIDLTNYFYSKGIAWNMQSDWVYLSNVLSKETAPLMAQTNNKNILRWMHEDRGVEMDPHAHESQYLYPDVVKLMDSIGLPESKLVGGTIYNDSNGMNIWTNLENGQYGLQFPAKFWKPDYLMSGGTPNHVADLHYFGIWNPQSPANFLQHDTTQRLRQLANGCSGRFFDTTDIPTYVDEIRQAITKVQNGYFPPSGFYVYSVFFGQADLNNVSFYNKLLELADSVDALVQSTNAEWKTFKQAYTVWETTYNKQMFQWDCNAAPLSGSDYTQDKLLVYPNPGTEIIYLQNGSEGELRIWDLQGRCQGTYFLNGLSTKIPVPQLASGIYILQIGNRKIRWQKE